MYLDLTVVYQDLNSFLLEELAESALRASPARSGYPGDCNAVNNIAVEGMA